MFRNWTSEMTVIVFLISIDKVRLPDCLNKPLSKARSKKGRKTTCFLFLVSEMQEENELIKLLDRFPDKPWDWYDLSRNPNLTLEFLEAHRAKNWNWWSLSWNPNVTMEYVELHHDKNWDWSGLSMNPNVTMEYVEAHPDKNWDWHGLSWNPNVTMEFVEANPEKPWNYWNGLSQNSNVTMEYVQAHPDKNWNRYGLSRNPNVTMEYVEAHPEKTWDWGLLSSNLFKKHPFFKKKLPKVSPEQRRLLNELHHVFDMPPDQPDVKPIFRKGGVGYWDGWEACSEIGHQI